MFCERLIFSKTNPSRGNQISNYLVSDHCSSLVDAKEQILQKVDYAQDEITPYLDFNQKISRYYQFFSIKLYFAIISITIIGSVFFLILVYFAKFLTGLKHSLFDFSVLTFAIAGILASLVATWICGQYSIQAEGSGIAEMKSLLTGIEIQDFFSIKTLLAKYFSCIMVKVSGLGMGYEGAFIHIIGAFSYNITKLPYFKEIDDNHNRKSITLAGIAGSLVLAFGTPIGALIFAIDMCPVNFQLPNLFKCFISVSIAYFIWCVMYNVFMVSGVSHMTEVSYKIGEIHWFILLGIIEGVLCTLYLFAFGKYLVYKRASKKPYFANRYFYISIVTGLVAFVTYYHGNFRFGVKELVTDLTNLVDLHDQTRKIGWWYNNSNLLFELSYVLFGRLLMFWSFSSAAIPFGVFGPGLSIGVVLGRLYGEFINHYFGVTTKPNVFAACGCAAFLCGFTRSFAPMVCVIEMTGQIKLLLPMLITNLIGFLFSSIWNIGFFEMLIAIRKLPFMPTFMLPEKGMRPISDIMEAIGPDVLYEEATLKDVFNLLITKNELDTSHYVPIITRKHNKIDSYVKLESCFRYIKSAVIDIERITISNKNNMSNQLYEHLKKFISDYGENAHIIVSKTVWNFLKKITMKTNQFVIGQLANKTAKKDKISNNDMFDFTLANNSRKTLDRNSTVFDMGVEMIEKIKKEELSLHRKMINELLINVKVNFDDPIFEIGNVPIVVSEKTKLVKVHYIFLMLGIPVIWVQNHDGELTGKLTKDAFLKFKSN